LFSSSEVADFINATYEPAWESIRPAPLVTIDFGNGRTVKRTLQGNVATYVCGADGIVYDVLPGIYTPDVYLGQLAACKTLFESVTRESATAEVVVARLRNHHEKRLAALTAVAAPPPAMRAVALTGGGGKFGIEMPTQRMIAGQGGNLGGNFGGNFGSSPMPPVAQAAERTGASVVPSSSGFAGSGREFLEPKPQGGQGAASLANGQPGAGGQTSLAKRPDLVLDAQVNERIRRKAIHERLSRLGAVRPHEIERWLYKEVLHVDLDDPMLGVDKVLTENYPFAEEDRALEQRRDTTR